MASEMASSSSGSEQSKIALTKCLKSCGILTGSIRLPNAKVPESLQALLRQRLEHLDEEIKWSNEEDERSLKLLTGERSLIYLERVCQCISECFEQGVPLEGVKGPLLGMRDLKVIATLSSVSARWSLAPLLSPNILPATLIDTALSEGQIRLGEVTERFLRLVRPAFERDQKAQDAYVAQLLLPHLRTYLLAALLELGDRPDDLNALLDRSGAPAAIAMLLLIIQTGSRIVPSASTLLSAQLLKSDGVKGFLLVVVGDEDEEPNASKLEQVSRILSTCPRDVDPETYFPSVIEKLLDVLRSSQQSTLSPFVRLASYSLAQLVEKSPLVAHHLLESLHSPFFPSVTQTSPTSDGLDPLLVPSGAISRSIRTLSILVANSPPSLNLYDTLIRPILPQLFSVGFYPGGDPVTRRSADDLLVLWCKGSPIDEGVRTLHSAFETVEDGRTLSEGTYWSSDDDGGVCIRLGSQEGTQWEVEDVVAFLKRLDRSDVQAELFLRWLEEVNGLDPVRSLTRLQLVVKALEVLGPEMIKKPLQVLTFVRHTLQGGEIGSVESKPETKTGLDSLKFVDEEEDHMGMDEEMFVTGLTLLLATLEGNPGLSMETGNILILINAQLDSLCDHDSVAVAGLAREASTVLALRSASSSLPHVSSTSSITPEEGSRVEYRNALRLLEDPILPVRAQGLASLRSLMQDQATDQALVPGILDVFMRSIEEEDSFLYLNAIGCLAASAVLHGRQVAQRLVGVYVGRGRSDERALDKRLRIGEAIVQVVQQSGKALAVHSRIIVPPLLRVFRDSEEPVTLRSSALMALSVCVEASPLAMIDQAEDLLDACLTLLSIESRPLRPRTVEMSTEEQSETRDQPARRPEETPQPLTRDSKRPSLRRSAIRFVVLLSRSFDHGRERLWKRAEIVLGYMSQTDEDALVRHQAEDAVSELFTSGKAA